MTENNDKIKIYKRHNTLKDKLGTQLRINDDEGYLDPKKINKADEIISSMCKNCYQDIEKQLEILSNIWDEMQETKDANIRKEKSKEIFTIAHEIKDISSLCGYDLTAHFAESLRDYIAETALNLKNQRIIIQAHIDAMNTVHKAKIKDESNPIAEELKKMVKIAINKYK